MRVIGYAFDADLHCVGCTWRRYPLPDKAFYQERDRAGRFLPFPVDEHGIWEGYADSEGNELHAIFSTDECLEEAGSWACGDCRELF